MKLINRKRGTGKTHMLISASYVTGYPIICLNGQRRNHILSMAKDMNVNIGVYTYKEWVECRAGYGYSDMSILIDQADDIMSDVFERAMCCKVAAVTMTVPMEMETEFHEEV